MILKNFLILTFTFVWLNSAFGASFSKVFVQSGAETFPLEYVQYGAPPSITSPRLAQISAAPVGSVVPLSAAPNYLPPCGTPCVYPGSSVAVQPVAPNYVTYQSSVPVIVGSRDEHSAYEYSYTVYDENTGDHKSQREHSDGSVVRGEYSLIQPDGYIREVQYVADDLTGFNAIVKNFLPANVEPPIVIKENKEAPYHEVKNEPLKQTALHENESNEESKEKSKEDSHEKPSEEIHEKSSVESSENPSEESHEKSSEEHSHEKPSEALTASESHESKSEEKHDSYEGHLESVSSEEHGTDLTHAEHESEHPSESKESHEEPKEEAHEHKESHESHEELLHESHEKPSHEEHSESHEIELAHEGRGDQGTEENILVSYNDIIKCVQSAIRKSNGLPAPKHAESPLTYIILNKPC